MHTDELQKEKYERIKFHFENDEGERKSFVSKEKWFIYEIGILFIKHINNYTIKYIVEIHKKP